MANISLSVSLGKYDFFPILANRCDDSPKRSPHPTRTLHMTTPLMSIPAAFPPPPPSGRGPHALSHWWNSLTPEVQAKLIKVSRPDLTDRDVASLVGISKRTLCRFESYRDLKALFEARKPVTSKWRGRLRR